MMSEHTTLDTPNEAADPPTASGRWVPFVTIDSASTRDIDDALWIERTNEGFHIQVAIADPTRAVRPGSVIDERARLMGATVYARDAVIRGMLPPYISSDQQSLIEGKRREAMLVQFWLDTRLQIVKTDISFTTIRVRRRLAYEDIQRRIENPESRTSQMLVIAKELSLGLLRNRRGRGALAMYDLVRMLMTDEDGNLVQFKSREDTIGNIIVQEMMVLTNTAVAAFCKANAVPIVYRTHKASPAAPHSDVLARMIDQWISRGDATIDQIQKNFFMLAQKAKYEAEPNRHFALSADAYCHMSSPLRRYADLASMRQIKAHLEGNPLPYTQDQLAELATHLNDAIETRKEEREEGFKRVGIRNAEKAIESGKTETMADHEVLLALKVVRNTKATISAVLETELIRRMENGLLTDACYDTLFTEIPLAHLSEGLIAAFAKVLDTKRTFAMHLQVHASAVNFIRSFEADVEAAAPFFATARAVRVSDGREFVATGDGSRKRDAEQMAVSGLFMAMLGRPRAQQPQKPVAAPPPAPPSPAKKTLGLPAGSAGPVADASAAPPNSRGTLTTYCQHRKIPDATYSCQSTGPSHMPCFTAQATLVAGGKTYGGTGTSNNRKAAENAAAFDLLQRLKAQLK